MISARLLVLSGLLLATGGCVAAAIPVLAGSVLAKKQLDPARQPATAPVSAPLVTLPAEAAPSPALTEAPTPAETSTPAPAATELPVVAAPAVSSDSPFALFAAYTVAEAKRVPGLGVARQSVLIDPETLISGPKPLACKSQPLAVVIDLDPGTGKFDLADPPAAAPGLTEALVQVRAAGVTVFWTSSLPVAEANRFYTVLRAVGLDLDGTDRVLLVRKPDETRHARRFAAARDWCFIALVGDRAGDFEEAIDYLKDPDGPTMRAMEPLRGNGWFVTPNPID